MENEIWKDIPEYEGVYQVSNFGRVKSLSRLVRNRQGSWDSKERILNPTIGTTGYFYVTLSNEVKRKKIKVHQLVTMAFLGHKPCGHKLVVDHINNNRLDNRVINLQITTVRYNNSKDRKNKNSKYTGVQSNNKGTFRARLIHLRKTINLGTFDTEEEASLAYQNAVNDIENGNNIRHNKREKTSKYKGVSYSKRDFNWIAIFTLNGKTKRIGQFKTEGEAYEARCEYLESLNK